MLANEGRRSATVRGVRWLLGSFLFCPCHLPVTLVLLSTLLSGTVVGAALHRYPVVAAGIITLIWAMGTWRGLRLLRGGARCSIRVSNDRTASYS
jgi:hypothetical protein